MAIEYSYVKCKNAISPTTLPGLRYSLNPYFGCEHGCIYCYSPSVFRDEKVAKAWGSFVKAKVNITDALSAQLKKLAKGTVGVSTVTDPYQPLEAKLRLTRACLEVLSKHGFPVSIQTKSALVLRDRDLIKPQGFDVGVTITTLNRDLARRMEPRASSPDALAQVAEEFSLRGIKTWIFLGPIIPEVSDGEGDITQVIDVARRTKSKIIYDKLNIKPWVLESMSTFLDEMKPGLKERLPRLVGKNSEYWHRLRSRIEPLCKDQGVRCEPAFPC